MKGHLLTSYYVGLFPHSHKQGGWLRQRTRVVNKGHAARQQTRCAPHGPPRLATLHATTRQLGRL